RPPLFPDFLQVHPKRSIPLPDFGMTHASLKYAQLLTQGEIFQGDLFMPTKYQRDGPKNDQDCVQHSGPKCVGLVDENQPPTRQVDFGEAQATYTEFFSTVSPSDFRGRKQFNDARD